MLRQQQQWMDERLNRLLGPGNPNYWRWRFVDGLTAPDHIIQRVAVALMRREYDRVRAEDATNTT